MRKATDMDTGLGMGIIMDRCIDVGIHIELGMDIQTYPWHRHYTCSWRKHICIDISITCMCH